MSGIQSFDVLRHSIPSFGEVEEGTVESLEDVHFFFFHVCISNISQAGTNREVEKDGLTNLTTECVDVLEVGVIEIVGSSINFDAGS